ncbi:MAG: serine/threonine protein phosphatase [Thermoplasmata archaeon]|nr:serine/threonine protein phosphatase [Thermoplasmata archaeon]
MTSCSRSAGEVAAVLRRARNALHGKGAMVRLEPPLVIAGDVHGDGIALSDVLAFASKNGAFPVLLGDFIDRAPDGNCIDEAVRVMEGIADGRLLSLRGNHENFLHRSLGRHLHLGTDLMTCYAEAPRLLREFGEAFQDLPLCAATGSVLMTHAGLPPLPLDRADGQLPEVTVPLTWADPEEFDVHGVASFDRRDVEGFMARTGIRAVVRGHTACLNRMIVHDSVLTLHTSRVFRESGAGGINVVLLRDEVDDVDQLEVYSLDPPRWRRVMPIHADGMSPF